MVVYVLFHMVQEEPMAVETIHELSLRFLAIGAKMCSALGDDDLFDGRLATMAGFSFLAVHQEFSLVIAALAVYALVVLIETGAVESDSFVQHMPDSGVQFFQT